jgi:hypothetical protein
MMFCHIAHSVAISILSSQKSSVMASTVFDKPSDSKVKTKAKIYYDKM